MYFIESSSLQIGITAEYIMVWFVAHWDMLLSNGEYHFALWKLFYFNLHFRANLILTVVFYVICILLKTLVCNMQET